jgi:DNA-binding NarL/FixJ family response regulator
MRILLIDHHELFREGLRCILHKLSDEPNEILEAADFDKGLTLAALQPDIILLELNVPHCDGVLSIQALRERYPQIPVVVVSSEEDDRVISKVLGNGASGFVCKSASATILLGALRLALQGSVYVPTQFLLHAVRAAENNNIGKDGRCVDFKEYGLTARQMHVLAHLSAGLSNREISANIGLAEGTVKVHVAAIFQALRVSTRAEAVRVAKQLGLVWGQDSQAQTS